MKLKNILYIFMLIPCLVACIEDGVTTAPGNRPTFSVDTLDMGTVFSGQGTPTASFKVFNPHTKSIIISDISVIDDNDNLLRLNVDGIAGHSFKDVEIRGGDSIFIFVDANYPDLNSDNPINYTHHISFLTNGSRQSIPVTATAFDAVRLDGALITADTRFDSPRPYIIYDSLYVAPDVTLTLAAGTKLRFHDGASLVVDGSLKALGAPGNEIEMTGDRMGTVAGRIDYEIMSGQWEGIYFSPKSKSNHLEYASIRNTTWGTVIDSSVGDENTPALSMLNCQLRNSKGYVLEAVNSSIVALGCELAEASMGILALEGGTATFTNCTFANYYLFSAIGGPAIQFFPYSTEGADATADGILPTASFNNCIIYGLGTSLSHNNLDDTSIYFNRCLFRNNGMDDDHFIECLWDTDPAYNTVREEYHFDYRVKPESPAIGHALSELMPAVLVNDRYGKAFRNTLGAYGPGEE